MKNLQLTGNPFVDVGFGITATRQGKKSISDLTPEDGRVSVEELIHNMPGLKNLSGLLSKFWQNNSFTGINKGTLPLYKEVLTSLASNAPQQTTGTCQVCGDGKVYRKANRSWFPLAGGENDASTFPNLNGKWLCVDCFRAILLLPMGCKFCSTGPYFIHINDPIWQVKAVDVPATALRNSLIANAGNSKIAVPKAETKYKLSGRIELLQIVANDVLWDDTIPDTVLPPGGATIISFNNDKTASMLEVHLPAQALAFFAVLRRQGLLDTFIQKWAVPCNGYDYKDKETKEKFRNKFFDLICDDIEQRRSAAPLIAAIIQSKAEKEAKKANLQSIPKLPYEEKKILMYYEDKLLAKKERFDVLNKLAGKVKGMEAAHKRRFITRLSNMQAKSSLMNLLAEYKKAEDKYGLKVTTREIQVLSEAMDNEAVSLLFLLCVADEDEED